MPPSKYYLFEEAAKKWPRKMIILQSASDSISISTDPSDTEVYKSIEKEVGSDDWMQIACWSFHQSMSLLIKDCHARGARVVYPGEVTFTSFDTMMKGNLLHEVWRSEREAYSSLPLR
ncbi:MAG: hypothetical protein COC10_13300 [Sphingobium sp.]|nr:MAG: hypothetical protein COC10_13300 [Sphingobium sp.]